MAHEIYVYFLGTCSFIITVWAVIEIFAKIVEIKTRPNKIQDETLAKHTEKLKEHDKRFQDFEAFFQRDKRRLDDINQSNHVTQGAILALLSHALNGNDLDSLRHAKESLENYLTNK